MATNKRLNAVITIGGAITGTLKAALGTTKSRLLDVGEAIRKVKREQQALKSSADFNGVGVAADKLRAKYASLGEQMARMRREQERLLTVEKARMRNQARRGELRGQIGDTAAVAAAVLLPAGAAVKKSAEFGYQLQLIGNTANMTKLEVAQLGLAIMDASRNTGQSAENMQKAMGFLIAAGMNVKTAQASMVTIGRTATASGAEIEDLAKASFTLVDALGVKPGRELQEALDTLAQAGKEGNVELRDMARALPVLGAGFQAMKIKGREGAATMGAMLEVARKGAATADEAANNFENFLNKVTSPETRKKAAKMGLDISKVVRNAQKAGQNPLEAAIKAIAKVTKGDQEKIGDLFQDMQVANFIRPMIQNWKEYERIKAAALGANGVTDKDFAAISETTKQQMTEASNAIGRLGIAIGQTLEPAISKLATTLTPVIGKVTEFVTANRELVGNSILVVGGLMGLRLGLLGAAFAFTFVKGGVIAVVGAVMRLVPLLTFLGGTVLPMVGAALAFIARALLLNPIGRAVTAIAGGAYLIYKNWEPIKGFFIDLWDSVKAKTQEAVDYVLQKIQWVGEAWNRTKQFFGFGSEGPAPGAVSGSRPQPPALPSGAPGRAGGSVSQTNTFHITQQPGQDTKALADEVAKRIKQREAVQQRSSMVDAMGNTY